MISYRYDVALGVAGACGVPTRAGITCSTIAFRASGLLLEASGRESLSLEPPPNLLLHTYRLGDDLIRRLLKDLLNKGKMVARSDGELGIFRHLAARGPYPGHMGPPRAVLEPLLVRRPGGGDARFHPEIFSKLGPRPWDEMNARLPTRALRRALRSSELREVAAAVVDVRREWLERADGAPQTLAFCRRSRHHTGLLLRTDANLDGDASQSLQDIAQELVPFLVDEDDSQFEPDPEA